QWGPEPHSRSPLYRAHTRRGDPWHYTRSHIEAALPLSDGPGILTICGSFCLFGCPISLANLPRGFTAPNEGGRGGEKPRPMGAAVQASLTSHGSMLLALVDAPNVPAGIRRAAARVAGHEQGVSFVADVMEPAGQVRIDHCAAGVDRRNVPVRVTHFV